MASQVVNPCHVLKTGFPFLLIVCLVLQWSCTSHDNTCHCPDYHSTNGVSRSHERNNVTFNLTNQRGVKPETKPETTNFNEKTMCNVTNSRMRKSLSDRANEATYVICTRCGHSVNNLPTREGIFFKIPQHIHTRKTIIKMYADVYFQGQKSSKRLFTINETANGGFVNSVNKPLTGFVDQRASNISISGIRILFETFIFILCACMVYNTSLRQNDRIFDKDAALLTTSQPSSYSIIKETRLRFLNHFYNIPRVKVHVYPFSLNPYASDVVKGQKSTEELMQYEWSRYLSFKNFPMDCPMMPMRLAQAGFYYLGQDQEVKCFSCGMINRDWSEDETAVEVHKRLSPRCQFIHGENTDNIEIHAKEYYDGMFNVTSHNGDSGRRPARSAPGTSSRVGDSDLSHVTSTAGASGGPFDAMNHTPREQTNRSTSSAQKSNHSNDNSNNTTSIQSEPTRRGQSYQATATNTPTTNSTTNPTTTTTTTVSSSSPKHPQYTELSARAGSYTGWTLNDIQDPVELAQAGFFYTGVKDFVRCFYCGVGLKNWERGDDPWAEHSRWSHGCGHLLNSRAAGGSGDDTITGRHDSQSTSPAGNPIKNGTSSGNGVSDTSAGGASGSSDMDSAAARSLLDMGYTQDQVQTAVRRYRAQNGSQSLTAIALVDLLDTDRSPEDASSSPPQFPTSSSPTTSEQSSVDQSNSNSPRVLDQSITGQSHTSAEKGREHSPMVNREDMEKRPSTSEGSRSLLEENRELKSRMQSKICLDRNANMIFLPCGHMVACQTCAMPLRKCAICRKLIKGSVRVYQS